MDLKQFLDLRNYSVLDFGCRSGGWLFHLLQNNGIREGLGLDESAAYVEFANQLTRHVQMTEKLKFMVFHAGCHPIEALDLLWPYDEQPNPFLRDHEHEHKHEPNREHEEKHEQKHCLILLGDVKTRMRNWQTVWKWVKRKHYPILYEIHNEQEYAEMQQEFLNTGLYYSPWNKEEIGEHNRYRKLFYLHPYFHTPTPTPTPTPNPNPNPTISTPTTATATATATATTTAISTPISGPVRVSVSTLDCDSPLTGYEKDNETAEREKIGNSQEETGITGATGETGMSKSGEDNEKSTESTENGMSGKSEEIGTPVSPVSSEPLPPVPLNSAIIPIRDLEQEIVEDAQAEIDQDTEIVRQLMTAAMIPVSSENSQPIIQIISPPPPPPMSPPVSPRATRTRNRNRTQNGTQKGRKVNGGGGGGGGTVTIKSSNKRKRNPQ